MKRKNTDLSLSPSSKEPKVENEQPIQFSLKDIAEAAAQGNFVKLKSYLSQKDSIDIQGLLREEGEVYNKYEGNNNAENVFFWAIYHNDPVYKKLLELSPEFIASRFQEAIIDSIAASANLEILKYLLEFKPDLINFKTNDENLNLVHHFIIYFKHGLPEKRLEAIQYLHSIKNSILEECDFSEICESRDNSFFCAIEAEALEILKFILTVKPELLKVPNRIGTTGLEYAIIKNRVEIALYLLELSPDGIYCKNNKNESVLSKILYEANPVILDKLFKLKPELITSDTVREILQGLWNVDTLTNYTFGSLAFESYLEEHLVKPNNQIINLTSEGINLTSYLLASGLDTSPLNSVDRTRNLAPLSNTLNNFKTFLGKTSISSSYLFFLTYGFINCTLEFILPKDDLGFFIKNLFNNVDERNRLYERWQREEPVSVAKVYKKELFEDHVKSTANFIARNAMKIYNEDVVTGNLDDKDYEANVKKVSDWLYKKLTAKLMLPDGKLRFNGYIFPELRVELTARICDVIKEQAKKTKPDLMREVLKAIDKVFDTVPQRFNEKYKNGKGGTDGNGPPALTRYSKAPQTHEVMR